MTDRKQPGSSISSESFATVSVDYTVSKQDLIVMRRADWDRIYSNVKKLKNPVPFLPQVGWAAVTTGVGALIALAAWVPAYGQLPKSAKVTYAWITPGLAILGGLLILAAVACWKLNGRITDSEQVSVDSVVQDMDTCAKLSEPPNEAELVAPSTLVALQRFISWSRVSDDTSDDMALRLAKYRMLASPYDLSNDRQEENPE